jgi:hypothetical protein
MAGRLQPRETRCLCVPVSPVTLGWIGSSPGKHRRHRRRCRCCCCTAAAATAAARLPIAAAAFAAGGLSPVCVRVCGCGLSPQSAQAQCQAQCLQQVQCRTGPCPQRLGRYLPCLQGAVPATISLARPDRCARRAHDGRLPRPARSGPC